MKLRSVSRRYIEVTVITNAEPVGRRILDT